MREGDGPLEPPHRQPACGPHDHLLRGPAWRGPAHVVRLGARDAQPARERHGPFVRDRRVHDRCKRADKFPQHLLVDRHGRRPWRQVAVLDQHEPRAQAVLRHRQEHLVRRARRAAQATGDQTPEGRHGQDARSLRPVHSCQRLPVLCAHWRPWYHGRRRPLPSGAARLLGPVSRHANCLLHLRPRHRLRPLQLRREVWRQGLR
mmetsp:Transcript_37382/g.86284  ORF Transcript_37382/g.86284 Transcript_37382/m.86284 type:complete len:204 (+) Transcript_37382:614-1225(+)